MHKNSHLASLWIAFLSLAIHTQDFEHVLLGVEVVGVALNVFANDRDGVEFEHFDNEAGHKLAVVVVHQGDNGGSLEGEDGIAQGLGNEGLMSGEQKIRVKALAIVRQKGFAFLVEDQLARSAALIDVNLKFLEFIAQFFDLCGRGGKETFFREVQSYPQEAGGNARNFCDFAVKLADMRARWYTF